VPIAKPAGPGVTVVLALLGVVLFLSLPGVVLPGKVLFSNDGPVGRLMEQCHHLPERFTGCWGDLNVFGMREEAAPPNLTFGLQWLLKPVWFSKFYAPLSLLVLGLGAWCFLRQSGLAPPACILGGLAAALNSCFFSVACWGVAADAITFGMAFFALAALLDTTSPRRWLRVILAGVAVGMGVSEGADVGALFSVLVAAFVIYQAWLAQGSRVKNVAKGALRVGLVAICAGLVAAQAISELVAIDVEGVRGTEQDAKTKAERWNWATQWSLPKRELLGLVVPGLFGYRMATRGGGSYWGNVGRDAAWDKYVQNGSQGTPPTGFKRFVGGGFYAGVGVVLLALWAALQSLRRQNSIFNATQRKLLWFWLVVGGVSTALAFGRHAPFYRWLYALPYFSTIRNPVKFLYFLSFALVILFAYGVDGLWRNYMRPALPGMTGQWSGWKRWWAKAGTFDRRWVLGCWVTLGVSLVAWVVYASSSQALVQYLATIQIDPPFSERVAAFSIHQVGWFVLFFVVGAGLLGLIVSGAFAGVRARWGAIWLGLLVVLDLGRSNQFWTIYWDYQDKYASNPIIDFVRQRPFEHRVGLLSFRPEGSGSNAELLARLYKAEWMQQQLPFYNVQTLESVQMPRVPKDLAAFKQVFEPPEVQEAERSRLLIRRWQVSNTRFLFGCALLDRYLNSEVDPGHGRFRLVQRFAVHPKAGVSQLESLDELTAEPDSNGAFALYEFTGALPRARLYSSWQVITNDDAAIRELASPAFDPERSVMVSGVVPAPREAAGTNENPGSVEFASYAPKRLVLKSEARVPAVLLLNDHFDPNWKVAVDGRPAPLLRCNGLMRGVYLTPGVHTVEFRFLPPANSLYVSLAAVALGVLVLGCVLVAERRSDLPRAEAPAQPEIAAASGRLVAPAPKVTKAEGQNGKNGASPKSRKKARRATASQSK